MERILYQSWTGQLNRSERVQRADTRVRDPLRFPVRDCIKILNYSYNVYAEDLVQTCEAPVLSAPVSVSSYMPCLLYSEGLILLVSSFPSCSYNLCLLFRSVP